MLPEIGKIYTTIDIKIPVWKTDVLSPLNQKLNTNKDVICKLSSDGIFSILEYKKIEKDDNNTLLLCKILTEDGLVGSICLFQHNFSSWIKKVEYKNS